MIDWNDPKTYIDPAKVNNFAEIEQWREACKKAAEQPPPDYSALRGELSPEMQLIYDQLRQKYASPYMLDVHSIPTQNPAEMDMIVWGYTIGPVEINPAWRKRHNRRVFYVWLFIIASLLALTLIFCI